LQTGLQSKKTTELECASTDTKANEPSGTNQMTNERKNITQPADWWAAFGGEATKRGLTLSEFIGLAASKMLTRDQRKELSERIKPGRKKNEDLD
jgi:hypothetical protein